MDSAIALLSAGLDSAVNLYRAQKELDVSLALTLDYGQRAASSEILAAKKVTTKLGIPHQIVQLPWLKEITQTALVNTQKTVPVANDVEMDDFAQSTVTAHAVWVPNRNGVFLNVAASFAESLGAKYIIVGFNKEEAVTFPDNSQDFIRTIDSSLSYSTLAQVKVKCYTSNMDKTEIVGLGRELEVPFHELWPCYFSGEKICGECESCQRFNRALKNEGIL